MELNKEALDVASLLNAMVSRFKIQHQNKNFISDIQNDSLITNVDPFHFENALNNILDNAVKYGGDEIYVKLFYKSNAVEIQISDNGNSLTKDNKSRVFEKFYRIPKGNTHDVKGFGIGLYYTKTIIEKHNGSVILDLNNKLTTFKISLPNG